VQSPLRKQQFNEAMIALEKNVLLPIEHGAEAVFHPPCEFCGGLQTRSSSRILQTINSPISEFSGVSPHRRRHGCSGRRSFPDIIAEEARKLWDVDAPRR